MADRRFLQRIGGYLVAGVLLAIGAAVGGFVGAALIVLGVLIVVALLFTFRLH
jgi:hypothetical protein